MEKIIFDTETEDTCMFNHNIIGSLKCIDCDYLYGFDSEEKWIKCKLYSILDEHDQLEIENQLLKNKNDELENEVCVLNFMLKNKKNGGL